MSTFRPDIVIVGMGMPAQEMFLLRHLQSLPPAHYATVGGAIDYVAGHQKLSPRFLGRLGLEWLWRFAHDPRRLGQRYFVEPFLLASIVVARKLGGIGTGAGASAWAKRNSESQIDRGDAA